MHIAQILAGTSDPNDPRGRIGPDSGTMRPSTPGGAPLPPGVASVRSDYFLVMLDTAIGRHERRSEALLQRAADGRSTDLKWHRPHPLIELNETDESRQ